MSNTEKENHITPNSKSTPSSKPTQKPQQSKEGKFKKDKNKSHKSAPHSQKKKAQKEGLPKDQEPEAGILEVNYSSDIIEMQKCNLMILHEKAKTLDIPNYRQFKKNELIYQILQKKAAQDGVSYARGVLELLPDGYGFLRTNNYLPSGEDIYVSQTQIKRFKLKLGDTVSGQIRPPKEGERYFSLLRIDAINTELPEIVKSRPVFSNLTPIYPHEQLKLECGKKAISGRIMDMMVPIGKGQRSLIVSPPKAGKTSILKEIADSISTNHPEVMIKVLLIDERPEEVTDMERSINGEVIYSTFDEPPEQHVKVSELVLESAMRLVECGKDVLILLDSITRLARAYNLVVPPSGRTLSGGLDPSSLHKPKRFFGGARKIENGGSLTIIATALVDTGSRMDDIIYEEFKGTGNMELHLDRKLANRRIFPAIDIINSGTRKEELLIGSETLKKTYLLRKNIDSESSTEELIKLLLHSESNEEFLNSAIFSI